MRRFAQIVTGLVILLSLLVPYPAGAQEAGETRQQIEAPSAGEAVQGLVQISATITAADNRGGSLSFRYAGIPDANWFTIWQSDDSLVSGVLTVWDTTTITDGMYDMLLQVRLAEGDLDENLVPGIRVRNYTPIETSTPSPTLTIEPGRTNTPAIPTPTSLELQTTPAPTQVNPASISEDQIYQTILVAGAGALAVFLLVGLYFGVGSLLRRRR